MIKVAITGNIASGKSLVQKYLIHKGYKVIDTDDIAKNVRNKYYGIITETFSNFDITDGSEISAEKLGKLIFKNDNLRQKLNDIMHPLIFNELENYFEVNKNETIVFVGIPLLFECQVEKIFDRIIFVYSSDDIRLKRLVKRNNITEEEALSRLNSQIPQDKKLNLSDFIIKNDGTIEDLNIRIDEIISKII